MYDFKSMISTIFKSMISYLLNEETGVEQNNLRFRWATREYIVPNCYRLVSKVFFHTPTNQYK